MPEDSSSLEAVKLISDWAKWLITIETVSTAVIGAYFVRGYSPKNYLAETVATLAIVSFLISIAAACILLLTLPKIAQSLRGDQNVWMMRDSVVGRILRANTQILDIVESFFFGIGLVFATLMRVTNI